MPDNQDQQQQVSALLEAGQAQAVEGTPAPKVDDQEQPRKADPLAKLDDVTALLADPENKTPQPAGDAGAGGQGDKGGAAGAKVLTTLAELADVSGLKIADVYKLHVPMRDGVEPMTLGAIKDAASKAGDLEALAVELDERRATFENDMIRSRGELNQIVALLPEIPDALIAKARDAHLEHLQVERKALFDVKPEWKDDATYARAQDDILEAVADYGFSRTDLDLVIDHRLTKLLHDFAGMKKRITKANARAKEIRETGKRGGQRVNEGKRAETGRAAAVERAKSGTTGEKVRAVTDLLAGATG